MTQPLIPDAILDGERIFTYLYRRGDLVISTLDGLSILNRPDMVVYVTGDKAETLVVAPASFSNVLTVRAARDVRRPTELEVARLSEHTYQFFRQALESYDAKGYPTP